MANGPAKPAKRKATAVFLIKIDFGAEQDGRPFTGNRESQEYERQRMLKTGNSLCLVRSDPSFSNEQSIGELNQRKDDGGEQWQQQIHIDWPAIVLKSLLVFNAAK